MISEITWQLKNTNNVITHFIWKWLLFKFSMPKWNNYIYFPFDHVTPSSHEVQLPEQWLFHFSCELFNWYIRKSYKWYGSKCYWIKSQIKLFCTPSLIFFYFFSFRLVRFCVVTQFFHPLHNGQWYRRNFLSQILSITFIFLS